MMGEVKFFKYYHGPTFSYSYGKLDEKDNILWSDGDIIPFVKSSLDIIDVISEEEYIEGLKSPNCLTEEIRRKYDAESELLDKK